ncbi:hypothetical protein [Methanocalculus sp. MC3]
MVQSTSQQPDYYDAAKRHFDDATYLFNIKRCANSDHLYGLSSECALKSIMLALGMGLTPSGSPQKKKHRTHINQLWSEFISFANTRNGSNYTRTMSLSTNPFDKWDVADRYKHRREISNKVVGIHQKGAEDVMRILEQAQLDGIIK